MRLKFLCGGALLAALAISAPALAQNDPELGSRLTQRTSVRTPPAKNDLRSILAAHGFFSCLVRKRESAARTYLEATAPPESTSLERGLFRQVECLNLGTTSHFSEGLRVMQSPDVQRGMIAEQLIKRVPQAASLQPLPRLREYHSAWLSVSGREPVVEEMAVCVAATNPAGIRALLEATPESPEEQGGMRSLSPSFGSCLVVNARLTANRQSMRAALAEALYHRAASPEEPVGAAPATEKK